MRRFFTLIIQTIPLLVAMALYGYVLRLPFFADDIPNFWILDHTNGLDIWGGSLAYQYYRPMTFTLWKLQYWLAGGYDAVFFHWVQLAFFGLTGVLVGLVTRRLLNNGLGLLTGVLAGVLYVVFPFSYNVLGFVGALFHTTLVFFFLLCLWTALCYWDGKPHRQLLLVVCWLSALAGIFSHENGPLLIPLLFGVWLVAYWRQWRSFSLRRLLLVLGPVVAIGLLFVVLWVVIPRGDFGDDLQPNADMVERAALLLQGLGYPVSALGRLVIGQDAFLPVGDGLFLFLLSSLLLLVLIWWRTSNGGPVATGSAMVAVFGWLWYVLSLAPAVLFLETGYVAIAGARLIMLASVGSSIFFGTSVAVLLHSPLPEFGRWRGWLWRGLGLGLLVVLLGAGVGTVIRFRAGYERLDAFTDRFLEMGQALSIEVSDLLLVNAPDYVDIEPLTYLYGIERVVFMTPGLKYSHFYALNLDAERPDITSVAYSPTVLAEGYGAHEPHVEADELRVYVRESSHIMVTRFSGDDFWPEVVGGMALPALPGDPVAHYPVIDYTLRGARARYQPVTRTLIAQVDWQAGGPAAVKQYLHVYCDGEFIAQADGYPLGDLYPFSVWEAGEQRSSLHTIHLLEAYPLDCLQIYVGLYDEDTGDRLIALSSETGEEFPTAGVLVPLVADDRGTAEFFNP